MRLEILPVPDCPATAVLDARLAQLLTGHPHMQVTRQIIASEDEAERRG
jgi:hypothetical protein